MNMVNFNEVYTLPGGATMIFSAPNGAIESPVEYDADGWSVEMRNGCVRCKEVDEWLDNLAANGDVFEKEAAARLPRWFSLLIPTKQYTEDEMETLVRNFQQMYSLTTLHLARFYPNIKSKTDKGEALPGYGVPIKGFNIGYLHKEFADRFIGQMKSGIRRARVKADPNGLDFRNYYRN